ncbi:MAG: extracellular solute-binding protein [Burkholderiaceae bacterium]
MTKQATRHHPGRRQLLAQGTAMIAGLTLLPGSGRAAEAKELNFYNWDTYIGENTLDDFREATGIRVKMDLYADNDELFAKLKAGNPGYDVIVPTNDYVERMIIADMLMPLDHDKLPNMANIAPRFIKNASFDPGRQYSLPYMWGTIGILVTASPRSRVRSTAGGRCSMPTSTAAGWRCSVPDSIAGHDAQVPGPLVQLERPGAPESGRGSADRQQERHQGVRRRQRPGPARRRRRSTSPRNGAATSSR